MATRKLDAAAAAAAIRHRMSQPEAEDRHVESFAKKVLDQLGLDHSLHNIAMAVGALHREGIVPHEMQEYPKQVQREGIDPETEKPYLPVVVNSEDDEKKWRSDFEPPAPLEQNEYPETVMRRGTDAHDQPVVVRDLKEEREVLGLDHGVIEPAAPRQEDQAYLRPVTESEIEAHEANSGEVNAKLEAEALQAVNSPHASNPAAPPTEPPGKQVNEEFRQDQARERQGGVAHEPRQPQSAARPELK